MPTGLFVGRFQPFHNGHLATIRYALGKVDLLIIVVGSAQKSHESRNPFTAGERIEMIKNCLDVEHDHDWSKVLIIPVPDVDIHSLWTRYLDLFVPKYDLVFSNDPFTILLFRERGTKVIEPPLQNREQLSATEVRSRIKSGRDWKELVPLPCAKFISKIGGVGRVKALPSQEASTISQFKSHKH